MAEKSKREQPLKAKTKRDQPHDRFFREMMQDPEQAKEFGQTHLDKAIVEAIAWNELQPCSDSLVGENSKQLHADVVYTAKTIDGATDVTIIFNHERKADPLLPIRQQEYILGELRRCHMAKKEPGFVVFTTWHNGPKGAYTNTRDLLDYFKNKEMAKRFLYRPCKIINPSNLEDAEMAGRSHIYMMELLMKHADQPNFLDWLTENPEIAQKLAEHQYIDRGIEYVVEVGKHKPEDIYATLEKISNKLAKTMLTTEKQILNRGMKQGVQLGMQRGVQQGVQQGVKTRTWEIAKNMFSELHLDVNDVHQATGLSMAELTKLQKAG